MRLSHLTGVSSSPLRGFATFLLLRVDGSGRRVLIAPTRVRNTRPRRARTPRSRRPHRPYEGSQPDPAVGGTGLAGGVLIAPTRVRNTGHGSRRRSASTASSSPLRGFATGRGSPPPYSPFTSSSPLRGFATSLSPLASGGAQWSSSPLRGFATRTVRAPLPRPRRVLIAPTRVRNMASQYGGVQGPVLIAPTRVRNTWNGMPGRPPTLVLIASSDVLSLFVALDILAVVAYGCCGGNIGHGTAGGGRKLGCGQICLILFGSCCCSKAN